jgi:hypothetical protein
MTISEKEICDNSEKTDITLNSLTMGPEWREIWKKNVIADGRLFEQLFEFVFSDDSRLAWYSCWIIDIASEQYPDLLNSKIEKIISGLISTNITSLKRHFTRILCRYQIPEDHLGALVNRCYELLVPSEPAAVRVFAMQLLFNMSLQQRDLKGELICVIETLIEEGGSAGFANRAEKLLRQLRP